MSDTESEIQKAANAAEASAKAAATPSQSRSEQENLEFYRTQATAIFNVLALQTTIMSEERGFVKRLRTLTLIVEIERQIIGKSRRPSARGVTDSCSSLQRLAKGKTLQ